MVNTFIIDVNLELENEKRVVYFLWGHHVIGKHCVNGCSSHSCLSASVADIDFIWRDLVLSPDVSFGHLPDCVADVLERYVEDLKHNPNDPKYRRWRFLPTSESGCGEWGLTILDQYEFRNKEWRNKHVHSEYPLRITHERETGEMECYYGNSVRIGGIRCDIKYNIATVTASNKEYFWFEMLKTVDVPDHMLPHELTRAMRAHKHANETLKYTWRLHLTNRGDLDSFVFAKDE